MFNVDDYQKLAMRTSPDGHDRMMNGCMGLIGEAGEVVDIVKKWKFQSGEKAPLPKGKLIEELGDVLWYCAEICTGQDLDMMDEVKKSESDGLVSPVYLGLIHIEALYLAKLAQAIPHEWLDMIEMDLYKPDFITVIAKIINLVEYMLRNYCDCSLTECMQQNIEKLKRRYPDGFDPDRSLHRDESVIKRFIGKIK